MLESPRIVEALDELEGAERYKALALMLDSVRAKKVVLFNKETRHTAGAALTKHALTPIAPSRRGKGRGHKGTSVVSQK